MIIERVLESIVLTLSSLSFLTSLITLILIFIYVRPLITNVPIILTCNTYITLIGSSFMTFVVMAYGMYDNLHPFISFDDYYCEIRSYVNYVFICAFYYSCMFQATFRLCRVVFQKRKILQTRIVFTIAIIIQWLISIFYILVYLILNDFQYHPDISSCWLSFKNIRGLSIALIFVYGKPLIIMSLIYVCIVRFIRQTVHTQEIRQNANKRDLLVVKRIIILVFIAMAIGIPTLLILIIYIITNHLTPFAYHIQALSLTVGLVAASIAMGFITPQVRDIFKVNRQIHPVMAIEIALERKEITGNHT
ncbi:unnamed protein product [Rotaria sordida]|uniref:G-protein coupled receptors family 1 profile domain-containing protein n=1 Tax=Rotaria sordida TaxID=392033 RepID=A0A818WDY4_9BILA|nr:unnamed protein product [Rotaria sordida]CAF3723545.1 unnamed protein product [Rotaria sordida]